MNKSEKYDIILEKIKALLASEDDWISAMATVVCELHHSFEYFHWTGFYRKTASTTLKIGPYQGTHGCLSIDFSRGVCGKAAREGKTQLVYDVNKIEDHIACSVTTQSEIVIPVLKNGETLAVLDVDSNLRGAFDEVDQINLEKLCGFLSMKYFH